MEEEEKEEDVWSTVAANTKGRRVLCTQVSCSMKDCDARGTIQLARHVRWSSQGR